MKQTIICAMLFLVALSSFSQPTNTQPSLTQDYIKKSKNQKKTGNILLFGGLSVMVTSFLIPEGELVHEGINLGIYDTSENKNDGIKAAFLLTGFIATVSSIPLFIWSGKNRRKAASLSFKNESTVQMHNQNLVYTSIPAINIKYRISK